MFEVGTAVNFTHWTEEAEPLDFLGIVQSVFEDEGKVGYSILHVRDGEIFHGVDANDVWEA